MARIGVWEGPDSQQKIYCQTGLASGRLAPASPAWLLDTWRLCLVPGVVNTPYVALSYVWGKDRFFKTLKNNVVQLQKDRAFSDCHIKLGVPRTIADAISVVGLLEERYLWVDALCIVQDDESTRHDQLNNMASIFAAATVTIIAMQGPDANYGLRGLRGISQPRNLTQNLFRLAKGYQVMGYTNDLTWNIWSRRGWTCQEELFSKRTLVFDADMIQWRCACSCCFENLWQSKSHRNRSGLNVDSSLFSSTVPDLVGYGRLVRDYNQRELTHPEDVLAAFAGITTALSQTFSGGFICGVPSLFFDIALCWGPGIDFGGRRSPACSSSATMAGLPSWSWAGWDGEITTSIWEAGCDYIKSSQSVSSSAS
jgi:hypothetical protein